ncbi:OmpA/MotB family protein, partial [Photobacterium sanctipauli]
HTDNIPIKSFSFPSNWHLSRARAEAFSLKLINLGVSDELISVLGMGDTSPLKPNNSPENRALNRRIEVKHILSY